MFQYVIVLSKIIWIIMIIDIYIEYKLSTKASKLLQTSHIVHVTFMIVVYICIIVYLINYIYDRFW